VSYDAVVFDMDGVLLTGYHTPREVYREAAAVALAEQGVEKPVPDNIVDPGGVEPFRRACEDLGVDAETLWAARERGADARENALIAAGERPLFEDVDALADLTVPLGIVSNNRDATVEFAVEHFSLPVGAARGRDPTLAGYERMKPDPYYLEAVIEDLGVTPARSLFVGDRRSDVRTGHAAGADAALLVRNGDPPDGEPDPEHRIRTLSALRELV
jgi:HAD superfamily hydrolase (TIGR01509 family)